MLRRNTPFPDRRTDSRPRHAPAAALIFCLLAVGGLLGFVTLRMDWERLAPLGYGVSGGKLAPPADTVRRAAFHEGRLWLVTHGGELWSLAEHDSAPRRELPEDRVVDLCRAVGGLKVLTGDDSGWMLIGRRQGTWSPAEHARSPGDIALALVCTPRIALLTDHRLVDLQGDQPAVRLQTRLPTLPDNRVTPSRDQLFFATNHGEVGAVFFQIDRTTGDVREVRDDGRDDFCGGLINGCREVTSAVVAPWDPDCLVLTQAASHFGGDGGVLQMCGTSSRWLYRGPCFFTSTGEGCTEEFFGLISRRGTVLAAGSNGLVELDERGVVQRPPLPAMKRVGAFRIGFGDDFAVVNEYGDPPSGAPPRPLLVALDAG